MMELTYKPTKVPPPPVKRANISSGLLTVIKSLYEMN